ncbi:MAG TPA: SDR family NAD(P)-dependent oxidoreductase, partial [Parafilimonas sp.]
MKKYTLITGAGAGIGKALAMECASRQMNLLIVALPGKELDDTITEIKSTYKTIAHSLGIDLTQPNAFCNVYKWIKENNFNINILINNVGIGSKGKFENTEPVFYEKQLQLNVNAVTMLTRLLLNDLKAN